MIANRTILALDTATKCGWAIWSHDHIDKSGTINLTSPCQGRKLRKFREWLQSTIQQHHITEIVAEDIFYNPNKQKAFWSLGAMRGIILLVAECADIPVTFIPPSEHKHCLCHSYYAKKEDTQKALKRLGYGLIEDNDEADAIALLLTHLKFNCNPSHKR